MAPNRYYSSAAPPATLAAALPQVAAGAAGTVQLNSVTGVPGQYPWTLLLEWGTASQEAVTITQAPTGTGPFSFANSIRGDDGSASPAPAHLAGAAAVHGVSARDYAEPQAHLGSAASVHGVTGALAPLASPAFTGTPTAPTQAPGDSSTKIATTAYVAAGYTTPAALSAETARAAAAEAAATASALNSGTTVINVASAAAPAAGQVLTATAPTTATWQTLTGGGAVSTVFGRSGAVSATAGDYSAAQVTGAAPLASPALTGSPTAPTQAAGDASTKIATDAFAANAAAASAAYFLRVFAV